MKSETYFDECGYPDEPEGDDFDACPTCKGAGTVNPLTAGYFCIGVEDCRDCDGTGRI